jgi:TolA-binding protein
VVKKQLEQSQQRLTVAQETVEAARADAKRAQRTADEATAKLSETERQLRAVKTASAKNEEIIEQLRRDNANLKRERGQNFSVHSADEEYTGPTCPELIGWRAHNWPLKNAKPKPAEPTVPATAASKQRKVTATIPAPPKPSPAVPTEPVKPVPAQDSGWWPFGKKPAAAVTNQPPAVKTPAAPETK